MSALQTLPLNFATYEEGSGFLGSETPEIAPLQWQFRLRVAVHVAKGLAYLHQCSPPFIHRDLKASNVLLAQVRTGVSCAVDTPFCANILRGTCSQRGRVFTCVSDCVRHVEGGRGRLMMCGSFVSGRISRQR